MSRGAGRPSAVRCTVRVAGLLDDRWATWFEGFTLCQDAAEGTTTLTGVVEDQAHLHGLLAKVRDLGLALVSLETAAAPDPARW